MKGRGKNKCLKEERERRKATLMKIALEIIHQLM
jgi:hypothetical protein